MVLNFIRCKMIITKEDFIKKIQGLDCDWFELSVEMTGRGDTYSRKSDPYSTPNYILPIYGQDCFEMTVIYKV